MIVISKEILRTQLLLLRDSISVEQRWEFSHNIQNQILNLSIIKSIEQIHCYCGYNSEVSTFQLMKQLMLTGKQMAVPIVQSNSKILLHSSIQPSTIFIKGLYNTPIPTNPNFISIEQLNRQKVVVLVPLVGFDKHCNRIGYGGGYYDRFLHQIPLSLKIGLAFSCQEIDAIPSNETDIPLDYVVTEQKIFSKL
jgi:5-formyltetrahydrofolate cyclo-ligase